MRLLDSHSYRGRDFENELDQVHESYAREGLARLERRHVPSVYSQRLGQTVYVKRTWCDYEGYMRGGIAVLLEAKSTGKSKLRHWRPDPKTEHQFRALATAAEYGCLALYIIRRGIEEARLYFPFGHAFEEAVELDACPLVERQWGPRPWPWLEVAWAHWQPPEARGLEK